MKTPRLSHRLGLNQPAHSPTARRMAEMAAAIAKDTDGEYRLDVFPESRLGPDPQMFADVQSGALDYYLSGATLGGVAPASALPMMPFAFAELDRVFAALDGGLGEIIRGQLAAAGLFTTAFTTSRRAVGRSPRSRISRASKSARPAARSPPISSPPSAPRPAWCRSAACTRP